MPIVRGTTASVRTSLFTLYRDNQRAVRAGRWKLIVFPKINKRLLFDLESDPHELRDLADDPAQARRLAHLENLLRSWQQVTDDRQPLRSDRPLPARIDLADRARKPDRHQPEWIRRKYF